MLETAPVFNKKKPPISCCDAEIPVIGRHIYRKYDIITDPDSVRRISSKGKMIVPITSAGEPVKVPLKTFLEQLIEFEMSSRKKADTMGYRFLHTLDVVLDRECTDEQAKDLVEELALTYGLDKETYFGRLYEHNGCRFVCLYMCERTYYKEPQAVTVYYPSNWYVDAVTRKRVKDGTPGGILLHAKGDVRSVSTSHFSKKSGRLKMGPGELRAMSYKVLDTVKTFYEDNRIGHDTYLLPRLDYTNFRGNNRNHIKNINTMYQIMEDVLYQAAQRLSGQDLNDYKDSFREIVLNLRSHVDQDDCVVRKNIRIGRNRRFKIYMNYSSSFKSLVYQMELYVDDFMHNVADAIDKIYEEFGVVTLPDWEYTMANLGMPGVRHEFSYRTYVWSEERIPEDRKLTDAQWYVLWVKNGRRGTFRPRNAMRA